MNRVGFLFLNCLLSLNILAQFLFLYLFYLFYYILKKMFLLVQSEPMVILINFLFFVPIVFLLFKLKIFSFVYSKSKETTCSFIFLDKYLNDKAFRQNVIIKTVIWDLLIFLLSLIILYFTHNYNFEEALILLGYSYLFYCGGVTPCYLFFGRRMKKS